MCKVAGSCPPDKPFDQQVTWHPLPTGIAGKQVAVQVARLQLHNSFLPSPATRQSMTSTRPMPQNKALTGATRPT